MDRLKLGDGTWLKVHSRPECQGRNCCIHNPSEHPLKNAPLRWRTDRGFMERVCPHGIGHPDPDDLEFKRDLLGDHFKAFGFEVHGCDGCCTGEAFDG